MSQKPDSNSDSHSPNADEKLKPNFIHDFKFQVIETHLDVFGHMNNATYLEVFEEARWALITERGFGLEKIMLSQTGPVVLEVHVKFLKELRNRDHIFIRTWCSSYRGKVGTITQTMLNNKGEECCRADFTVGFFDLKSRRLIEPTGEWKAAIGL